MNRQCGTWRMLGVLTMGAMACGRSALHPSMRPGGATGRGGTSGVMGANTGTGGTAGALGAEGAMDGGRPAKAATWTVVPSPYPEPAPPPCDNCWTSGPPDLIAVWSADSSRVWVASKSSNYKAPPDYGLLLWEDGAWRKGPGVPTSIASLSGLGRSELWVGGYVRSTVRVSPASWNGTSWVEAEVPSGSLVWANSQNDIWVCCQPGPEDDGSDREISHWDGVAWTGYPLPVPVGSAQSLWSRSAREAWLLDRSGMAFRFAGQAWTSEPIAGASRALAIWSTGDDDAWVVGGDDGIIHRWNGSWHPVAIPGDIVEHAALNDVWGAASDNLWVVGDEGMILHWDGERWVREDSGTDRALNALWGVPGQALWVVGQDGFLAYREL